MESKTHIGVRDLNVWYGPIKVLNHITMDIPDKKITAIIGPSGCGKTTFLKSLNRLIELQDQIKLSGQVLVDGENILDPSLEVTHLRKKLGLLLQRPQVLPMSIYDNVAYGPRIHGMKDKKELNELVEKYLKLANLWTEVNNRLYAPASRLSIGQQQRLCLARTLAIEPEVILGDETTSALDPISAQQIEQLLLKLKNRYTIVLVTHNLRQAKRLADYVIFFYLGDVIEHGPAAEFFTKPRYAKTKAYLEGRFIEDFKIDGEVSLKLLDTLEDSSQLQTILHQLEMGKILKILVEGEETVRKVSSSLENEGHSILEVRRLNSTNWEMIVQKQHVSYNI